MSRQRDWQIKKVAEGNCGLCGKKRSDYLSLCNECAQNKREYKRRKFGFHPWKKGSKGKPSKVADDTP